MRISFFYPVRFYGYAASYACYEIARGMLCDGVDVKLVGTSSAVYDNSPLYCSAIPRWLEKVAYKFLSSRAIYNISELTYKRMLHDSDVVFLWPGVEESLYMELKEKGFVVVFEKINCYEGVVKELLDAEYRKLNLLPEKVIADEAVRSEERILNISDYTFSPSPCVTESLLSFGLNGSKIIQGSYGLRESSRLLDFKVRSGKNDGAVKFVFAGRIGVRKGVHYLLKYWCEANICGELILVGHIEESFKDIIKPYLLREDIKHVSFVDNLISVLREADVFVLPSIEEGSPLVTYDAIGQGLPCLVSPMGGGGVVKHGTTGFVLNVDDEQGWINALSTIAEDAVLREQMSYNAWQDSYNYIWPKVAERRRNLLLDALGKHKP